MDFAERVSLLDRSRTENQYIDPEELHYAHSDDEFPENDLSSRASSIQSLPGMDLAISSEIDLNSNAEISSSLGSSRSIRTENMDGQPGKTYAPRASAAGRKSTKSALRVKPRNGQHARELERNRHAAANYRSRQKNQLDSLLTRVREEEDKMVKQKTMVYSLKEELWHLRNNLMARQQLQVFGTRNMSMAATTIHGQTFGFDPTVGKS